MADDFTAGALAMNGWPDERDALVTEMSNEGQFHNCQGALAEKHLNDPRRCFLGGICRLRWTLGVGTCG